MAATLAGKRRLLPFVVVLGIAAAALEGLGIGLMIPALGIVIGGQNVGGIAGRIFGAVGSGLDPGIRLASIAAIIVALVVLKNVFACANGLLVSYLYGRAGHVAHTRLTEAILMADFRTLSAEQPWRVLNALSNESWRLSDAVQVALQLAVAAVTAMIFLIFLMVLSWKMTIVVAIGVIAIQAIHHLISVRLKTLSRTLARTNRTMASGMLHVVHSGRLARMFQQESAELGYFAEQSEGVRTAAFVLDRRQVALPALSEVLHLFLFVSVIALALGDGLAFPLVASFVVLLYRMQPHVRQIQTGWTQLHSWSGSLEEVAWLMAHRSSHVPAPGTPFRGLRSSIRFEHIHFTYPGTGDVRVLHDLSFELQQGRATALVGPSGAGKTTIVNLLSRLLEPDDGVIRVDGADLSTLDVDDWRKHMALASQDLELAEGSVADNIAHGAPGASSEAIERVARLAGAHDFIVELPEGYATWIGYRGAAISAGQRQRIALARALLREPKFLVLDEATNALDGLSESVVLETLKRRAGWGTTLVISHHASTIAFCERVIELAPGRNAAQHFDTRPRCRGKA